jgi:hypothetical protein
METEVWGKPGIEGESIVIRVRVNARDIVSVFIGDWAFTRAEHSDSGTSAAAMAAARTWLRQHRDEAHAWYGELERARRLKTKVEAGTPPKSPPGGLT